MADPLKDLFDLPDEAFNAKLKPLSSTPPASSVQTQEATDPFSLPDKDFDSLLKPVAPSAPKEPSFFDEAKQFGSDLLNAGKDLLGIPQKQAPRNTTIPTIGPATGDFRPATDKEWKGMLFERELEYVKKHPGEQDTAEAFVGGIIPWNAQGAERYELMARAHPIANVLGTFTGFATTMLATAPIEGALRATPIIQGLIKAGRPVEGAGKLLAKGSKYMSRAIPRAIHFATAGFIKETSDSTLGVAQGRMTVGEAARRIATTTADMAIFALPASFANPFIRIPGMGAEQFMAGRLKGHSYFQSTVEGALGIALGLIDRSNFSINEKVVAQREWAAKINEHMTAKRVANVQQATANMKSVWRNPEQIKAEVAEMVAQGRLPKIGEVEMPKLINDVLNTWGKGAANIKNGSPVRLLTLEELLGAREPGYFTGGLQAKVAAKIDNEVTGGKPSVNNPMELLGGSEGTAKYKPAYEVTIHGKPGEAVKLSGATPAEVQAKADSYLKGRNTDKYKVEPIREIRIFDSIDGNDGNTPQSEVIPIVMETGEVVQTQLPTRPKVSLPDVPSTTVPGAVVGDISGLELKAYVDALGPTAQHYKRDLLDALQKAYKNGELQGTNLHKDFGSGQPVVDKVMVNGQRAKEFIESFLSERTSYDDIPNIVPAKDIYSTDEKLALSPMDHQTIQEERLATLEGVLQPLREKQKAVAEAIKALPKSQKRSAEAKNLKTMLGEVTNLILKAEAVAEQEFIDDTTSFHDEISKRIMTEYGVTEEVAQEIAGNAMQDAFDRPGIEANYETPMNEIVKQKVTEYLNKANGFAVEGSQEEAEWKGEAEEERDAAYWVKQYTKEVEAAKERIKGGSESAVTDLKHWEKMLAQAKEAQKIADSRDTKSRPGMPPIGSMVFTEQGESHVVKSYGEKHLSDVVYFAGGGGSLVQNLEDGFEKPTKSGKFEVVTNDYVEVERENGKKYKGKVWIKHEEVWITPDGGTPAQAKNPVPLGEGKILRIIEKFDQRSRHAGWPGGVWRPGEGLESEYLAKPKKGKKAVKEDDGESAESIAKILHEGTAEEVAKYYFDTHAFPSKTGWQYFAETNGIDDRGNAFMGQTWKIIEKTIADNPREEYKTPDNTPVDKSQFETVYFKDKEWLLLGKSITKKGQQMVALWPSDLPLFRDSSGIERKSATEHHELSGMITNESAITRTRPDKVLPHRHKKVRDEDEDGAEDDDTPEEEMTDEQKLEERHAEIMQGKDAETSVTIGAIDVPVMGTFPNVDDAYEKASKSLEKQGYDLIGTFDRGNLLDPEWIIPKVAKDASKGVKHIIVKYATRTNKRGKYENRETGKWQDAPTYNYWLYENRPRLTGQAIIDGYQDWHSESEGEYPGADVKDLRPFAKTSTLEKFSKKIGVKINDPKGSSSNGGLALWLRANKVSVAEFKDAMANASTKGPQTQKEAQDLARGRAPSDEAQREAKLEQIMEEGASPKELARKFLDGHVMQTETKMREWAESEGITEQHGKAFVDKMWAWAETYFDEAENRQKQGNASKYATALDVEIQKYNEPDAGEDITFNDLVDNIEALEEDFILSEELKSAIEDYRKEQADDAELGGRGDMDAAEETLMASFEKELISAQKDEKGASISKEGTDDGTTGSEGQSGTGGVTVPADKPKRGPRGGRASDGRELGSGEAGNVVERPTSGAGREVAEEAEGSADLIDRDVQEAAIEASATVESKGLEETHSNYHITDADKIGVGTPKAKYKANVTALKYLKKIREENRVATEEEQAILVKYVGWGGLAQAFDPQNESWRDEYLEVKALLSPEEYESAKRSTINAHYTSPEVISAMWRAVARLGFRHGRVLEPGMGIGHFLGLRPNDKMAFTGIEIDKVTGEIAKQLYQSADIRVTGFQETNLSQNFYDLTISNVPFADVKPFDPRAQELGIPHGLSLHDFFFAKAIQLVRPGGVLAFITSRYTMDKQDDKIRTFLESKADFLGAIRLPNTAFKANAGTQVTTDIIFLRKRVGSESSSKPWANTVEIDNGHKINEYFAANPRMVLGAHASIRGLYSANEYAVKPNEGTELVEQLNAAIEELPKDVVIAQAKIEAKAKEASIDELLPSHVKPDGYFIRSGKIYQKITDNKADPVEFGKNTDAVTRIIGIRDAVRSLIHAQVTDSTDTIIKEKQKELGKLYDAFLKKHGNLYSKENRKLLYDDPDIHLVHSLEKEDSEGNLSKAAIFTQRTIEPNRPITQAGTVKEGLTVSLNQTGKVDTKLIGQLTHKAETAVIAELEGEGLIFKDPTDEEYKTRDEYLSGNVRVKLQQAKKAAEQNKAYMTNVTALEKNQPARVGFADIGVKIGSPWISVEIYKQFLVQVSAASSYSSRVEHSKLNGRWLFKLDGWYGKSRNATEVYGTARMPLDDLLSNIANNKSVRVMDTIKDADGNERKVLNELETNLAEAKADMVKALFVEWLWKDADRRIALEERYNTIMNSSVVREHDGSHLTFPGMNAKIKFRKNQRNGVWQTVQNKGSMLAHAVGSGKTYLAAASAMEMKRLGIATKPLFVCLNANIGQFAKQFTTLYPGAHILVADERNFAPAKRARFLGKVATGNWDAVLITHSAFEMVPVSPSTFEEFMQEEIQALRDHIAKEQEEKGRKAKVKDEVKKIEKLEARIKEQYDAYEKDPYTTFEQLGVDMMFVDEADVFKNLAYNSAMTGVAGLGSKTGSDRAMDMLIKSRYIQKINNGRGISFMTGTPVSNTLAEAYTMMKFLQPEVLKEFGISHFDDWANNFGEVITQTEVSASGKGFKSTNRFAKLVNIPELVTQLRQMWNVYSRDMLMEEGILRRGIELPFIKGGSPTTLDAPRTPGLMAYIETLDARCKLVKGKRPQKGADNVLRIIGDGRKAAIDMRLVDPNAKDDPDSKLNHVIREAIRTWKDPELTKGKKVQAIFFDLKKPQYRKENAFASKGAPVEGETDDSVATDDTPDEEKINTSFDPYAEMLSKFTKAGIPRDQIAFIHDAKNDKQRSALFDKINSGKIRIIIGSRAKMGVGANIQERLECAQALDAPWRPRDIEQADGRIDRPGNTNKEIRILRWVTKGSFDAFMWQTLATKAAALRPLLEGSMKERTIEEEMSNFSVSMAVAADNPVVFEKVNSEIELKKLRNLKKGYLVQKASKEDLIKLFPSRLSTMEAEIVANQKVLEALPKERPTKETFEMQVNDTQIKDKKVAGELILARVEAYYRDAESQLKISPKFIKDSEQMNQMVWTQHLTGKKIGRILGFDLLFSAVPNHIQIMRGTISYSSGISETGEGTVQNIINKIYSAPEGNITFFQKKISELKDEKAFAEEQLTKAFPEEEKLTKLEARYKELEKQIRDMILKADATKGQNEEPPPAQAEERPDAPEDPEDDGAGGSYSKMAGDPRAVPKVAPSKRIAKLPVVMGGQTYIKNLAMPEMVKLARLLSSNDQAPMVTKLRGQILGKFLAGKISLHYTIFKDPEAALAVLAHEIGHFAQWLPSMNMKQGNLLGRLLSVTFRMMKHKFGGMDNKEFRQELIELTKYWNPWDESAVSASYNSYRKSSDELYAEFLSVLLNAPGLAKDMAPKFYEAFFKYLDGKQAFKAAFFQLQNLVFGSNDDLLASRQADVREGFAKGEQELRNKHMRAKEKEKSAWAIVKQLFWNKDQVGLEYRNKVAKRTYINPDNDPKYLFEENNMMGSFIKANMQEFDRVVYHPLAEAGIDWESLGEYMMYGWIIAGRAELGNPHGHTPSTAQMQLDKLRNQLGLVKWAALERISKAFHDWYRDYAAEPMCEDIFNEDQKALVRANSDKYAPFRSTKYIDEYVSSGIMGMIGNLGSIGNPATGLLVKSISMMRAAKRNQIKKAQMQFFITHAGNPNMDIGLRPAKVTAIPGKELKVEVPREDWLGVVTYKDGGKYKAYFMDKYVADSLTNSSSETIKMIGDVISKFSLNDSVFRPLFITFNLGFQSFNLVRDFFRSYKSLSAQGANVTLLEWWKFYKKAVPASKDRVSERYNPIIQEMQKNAALGINFSDLVLGQTTDDTEINRTMLQYSLIAGGRNKMKGSFLMNPILALTDWIKHNGDIIETIPKVAGWEYLKTKNVPTKERAHWIRNYVGTPNYRKGGAAKPIYNSVWLFSNVIMRGIEADYECATNPKTRGGWWWKTTKIGILPKILMLLGSLGLAGAYIKGLYDDVSEYDMTNYIVIPWILKTAEGKTAYIRIPMDESTRLVSGIAWKLMNAHKQKSLESAAQDVFSFTGGQVPFAGGFAPLFELLGAWGTYLAGKNPRDAFRGNDILTDDELAAGGVDALLPMVKWSINQLGLVKLNIHDSFRDEPLMEKVLAFTPILNRWLRITNYGTQEKLQVAKEKAAMTEARGRLVKNRSIDELIKDSQEGKMDGSKTSTIIRKGIELGYSGKGLKDFVRQAYRRELKATSHDPVVRTLMGASSNAQKKAILTSSTITGRFKDEAEFRHFTQGLIARKLISKELWKEIMIERRRNR